jgi:hypothetical protein
MALSKVNFNSMNVTPAASKAVKFNSSNNGLETGDLGGSLVLISTQTASSSSTINFTSGIDSTYKEYIFKFIDIHPATDNVNFTFQGSTDGGSNYNVTMTTTVFRARHNEADDSALLGYITGDDLAQSTSFQKLTAPIGNGNDESFSGQISIYSPSNTTFVKHFIARCNTYQDNDATHDQYTAGYMNTTSAINAVQFKMSSGNIDAGTIKMYGVK